MFYLLLMLLLLLLLPQSPSITRNPIHLFLFDLRNRIQVVISSAFWQNRDACFPFFLSFLSLSPLFCSHLPLRFDMFVQVNPGRHGLWTWSHQHLMDAEIRSDCRLVAYVLNGYWKNKFTDWCNSGTKCWLYQHGRIICCSAPLFCLQSYLFLFFLMLLKMSIFLSFVSIVWLQRILCVFVRFFFLFRSFLIINTSNDELIQHLDRKVSRILFVSNVSLHVYFPFLFRHSLFLENINSTIKNAGFRMRKYLLVVQHGVSNTEEEKKTLRPKDRLQFNFCVEWHINPSSSFVWRVYMRFSYLRCNFSVFFFLFHWMA